MNLDRTYQRELLEELARAYPDYVDNRSQLQPEGAESTRRYIANIAYLDQHGLVDCPAHPFGPGETKAWGLPSITARGMDFLADDGGLSAILGVVTVKLHEDTLKDLIGQRIAESDLPTPEKSRLLDQLKLLPGEAIKHLTLKLMDAGLSNWPAALQAIETFVHRAV
ncbi:hypothetical protein [Burkholderia savannae]|uniref:hypothetical protein n=1 Tax=Burkholderia savannae TaxID=1637837 RepID=UPI000B26C0E6|nr:hypothetical protein [Burkholderia savannae]